jgi:diguanylate cyclase (GGDEF)-like protein
VAIETPSNANLPWRILIVDDDRDIHDATTMALRNQVIRGRSLELLHAYSAKEAFQTLSREPDVSVVLLDVVMETPQAGLELVPRIRDTLGLSRIQIVMRTGQPGNAPERDVASRYEINAYLEKSQITVHKLHAVLTTSLRMYQLLERESNARVAIERVMTENRRFLGTTRLRAFAESSLEQMAAILDVPPDGMVCARVPLARDAYVVHVGTGPFARFQGKTLAEVSDVIVRQRIEAGLTTKKNVICEEYSTLFFPGQRLYDGVIYLPGAEKPPEIDARLIDFICENFIVIAENISLVTDMARLHLVDPLLSIPNRLALIGEIDRWLEQSSRMTSVMIMEIDDFADSNDLYGHQYGDRLLHSVSERLHAALDGGCVIARVSSSRFGIVGDPASLTESKMQGVFQAPMLVEGTERHVSCSFGIANSSADECTGVGLLRNAQLALKRAKMEVRGGYVTYNPEFGAAHRERANISQDLKRALSTDEISLRFQPQVELSTRRVVGVEALIRWQKADGSFVPPDRFIPVAEQAGLINALGDLVLRKALQASAALRAKGYLGIRMAVNASTSQFRQENFLDTIKQLLAETGTQPNEFELEVTESIAVLGVDYFIKQLNLLRDNGIEIAIDDFGTGYSSLSYLDQLPADRLKIDRSFVWALESTQPGKRIAEMVITLARKMDMRVLAEGVETQAQAEILASYQCDEAQGYFYSPPLTLSELMAWLDGRQHKQTQAA